MQNFSVLMSVYIKECPAHFNEALNSILVNQTLKPTELVLVCDGELTAELEAVIDKYQALCPGVIKVFRKENGGLGRALNFGLPKCSYDIVARADTDDICKPTRFERQVSLMESMPEIDVVGAWVDEFENDVTNVISVRKLPESHNEIYEFGKSRCPVNHPVVMFRKKAVESVGGYQHFYLLEDYYLWVRMLVNGAKFYNLQESLLWFRTSPEMFKRRGGWKYACAEAKFQWGLYRLKYIKITTTIKNIIIRFSVRISPNCFRKYIYTRLLRK